MTHIRGDGRHTLCGHRVDRIRRAEVVDASAVERLPADACIKCVLHMRRDERSRSRLQRE
jgi:hypothetical protein